jgi:D-alanyl-D-alanine carboxypeptidase/D-alanyl-D-alanine-endopeptidase (penicillin-binding protein 4)
VAGTSGTLKTRLTAPAVAGRVKAKSGTVRGGRALSGYATTAAGRDIVFSILANGDDATLSTPYIDELVEMLVALPG